MKPSRLDSKFIAVEGEKEAQLKKERRALELKFKAKIYHKDPRYYNIKADFSYLIRYNIELTHQIGRGGYGVVYKGISLDPIHYKLPIAIKANFKTVAKQVSFVQTAFLTLCRKQPNLPKLINIIQHDLSTHIVTEYIEYTHFIDFFHILELEDIKHYMLELFIGLKSLKDVGIFHRDIKPTNFLYNLTTRKGVIVDLGLAESDRSFQMKFKDENPQRRRKADKMDYELQIMLYDKLNHCLDSIGRRKIGTESYMPIESLLRHQDQNYQSDIWPAGVILLSFVLRKYNPFNHISDPKQPDTQIPAKSIFLVHHLIQLASFFGTVPVTQQCLKLGYHLHLPQSIPLTPIRNIARLQGYNSQLQDLLLRLLNLDMTQRIKVQDAIKHPFLNSVRSCHPIKKK